MPMPADPVSVTVAVGAAPYQEKLASRLLSAGTLRQLVEFVLYLGIQEPNGRGELERLRRFPAHTTRTRGAR